MIKSIARMVFLILLIAVLTSCEGIPHSTGAVKRYIQENISKSPIVIVGPETDKRGWRYWILYFEDKPDYKFWVETVGSSVFGIPAGYELRTNYDSIFSYYYLNEFNAKKGSLLNSKLDDTVHNIGNYIINGYYSSEEEAHILAEAIHTFYTYVNQQKYPCKIKIECHYLPAQNDEQIKNYILKIYSTAEYAKEIDWTSPNDEYARYLNETTNIEDELINHLETYYEIKKDYEDQIKWYGKILHYR
ncbi:hypothetical protein ACYULU_12700 [Breznakiellaceae bacterium SP9]